MSTTSNFSSNNDSTRACSAKVARPNGQSPCQRAGQYPDTDGVRWWCGLHTPDRKVKAAVEATQPIAAIPSTPMMSEALDALTFAYNTLLTISHTRDTGWAPNTSAEKYKVIMANMADGARDAASLLMAKITRLKP